MIEIRAATPADAPGLCAIYNPYVTDTVITFEEVPVGVAEMRERIATTLAARPWLVAARGAQLLGYAYAGPWDRRSAYRYTVESTIYLDREALGRGIGGTLYAALLAELGSRGLRQAIGRIALPNPASVALHERLGFVKVGHLEAVGYKLGRSIDVGYWQCAL